MLPACWFAANLFFTYIMGVSISVWVWDNWDSGMSLRKLLHLGLHLCSKDLLSLHLLTLALVYRVFSADFNPHFSASSSNFHTQILSYFWTLPQQSQGGRLREKRNPGKLNINKSRHLIVHVCVTSCFLGFLSVSSRKQNKNEMGFGFSDTFSLIYSPYFQLQHHS